MVATREEHGGSLQDCAGERFGLEKLNQTIAEDEDQAALGKHWLCRLLSWTKVSSSTRHSSKTWS